MCKQWSAIILWASVVSVPDLRNSFSESSTKQQRQHANKRWSKLVGAISQKHMRAHHICNVNANASWTTVKERLLAYALSNAFIFTLRSRLTGSCIPWNQSHDPDVRESVEPQHRGDDTPRFSPGQRHFPEQEKLNDLWRAFGCFHTLFVSGVWEQFYLMNSKRFRSTLFCLKDILQFNIK